MLLSAERAARRYSKVLLAAASITCFASECPAAVMRMAQATTPAPAPAGPATAQPQDDKQDSSLGTPAVVIDGQSAESLLGKKVQSAKGEDLGRIVDVIVDKAGQIRAAVIDFGGFLGVGSRKIAVDWHAIHMTGDGKLDHLIVSLPQDQLRSAPAYKEGEPVVVIGPPADQTKPKPAAAAPAVAPAPTAEVAKPPTDAPPK